jgi:hypothetical protein
MTVFYWARYGFLLLLILVVATFVLVQYFDEK